MRVATDVKLHTENIKERVFRLYVFTLVNYMIVLGKHRVQWPTPRYRDC